MLCPDVLTQTGEVPTRRPPHAQPDLLASSVQRNTKHLNPKDSKFAVETEAIVIGCLEAAVYGRQRTTSGMVSDIVTAVSYLNQVDGETFEEMCVSLGPSPVNIHACVFDVWNGMFEDNVVNWGRVTALLAFSAHLASYCERRQLGDTFDSLSAWTTSFIDVRLKGWIVTHGGWENLASLTTCSKKKKNAKSWTSYLTTGVAAGFVDVVSVLAGYR